MTKKKLDTSPNAPKSVAEVTCKARDNFSQLDDLYKLVLEADKEVVILSSGLVTRPLVHKLVAAGLFAYDLGHVGLWFNEGHPIPLADCRK